MIRTGKELAETVKKIATSYKTLYVMGCFGAPLKAEHKERYCKNCSYNKQPVRTAMIKAASADTFGFDCVCLIKGVLGGGTVIKILFTAALSTRIKTAVYPILIATT